MYESDVERYLVHRVKTILNGTAEKFTSPARRSVPDRLVTIPVEGEAALIVFVELKAPGKCPTAAQDRDHERRRALGAAVFVLDSKAKVDWFIDFILEAINHAE